MFKDFDKHLREGKLSRRELFSTAGKVGVGAAAASMAPMGSVLAAPVRDDFPPRKVLWLTMVRVSFFVPVAVGQAEAAAFYGWDTQFNAPESYTPDAVIDIFMNYIEQEPDAIAFAYVEPNIFDTAIEKAREKGIFLITFNTEATGRKEHGLAYVGQDMIYAGRVNGQQAAKYAQEVTGRTDGMIVISNPIPGHSALEARALGTAEGVAKYNELNKTKFETEVLATATTEEEYVSKVEAKWIAGGGDIVAFAGTGSMTFGLGLFLKSANLAGKVAAGGFDLDDPTLMGIRDGRLQWTIGQDPYSQGWVTSSLIWAALERKIQPNDYITAAEIIDASNIDMVIERESLWKDKAKEAGF
jgi:ribose transport system substrate-binding protein